MLHNIPVVWDIRKTYPDAQIDWVVEEAYVDLLKPLLSQPGFRGIDHIIPVALRRWRKLFSRQFWTLVWRDIKKFFYQIRSREYDLIIETQGLIKSAVLTRMAKRSRQGRIFGLANQTEFSGYEPLARFFYTDRVTVPFHCHAVYRSRLVVAEALVMQPPNRTSTPPAFYPKNWVDSLKLEPIVLGQAIGRPYVLCFHASAWEAKCWDEGHWIQLGQHLVTLGLVPVFPWGNERERELSERLALRAGGIVPDPFSLMEAFPIISKARLTIGVDTGLTHMAAIIGAPTIELYVETPKWKTEGYWHPDIINLGDKGTPPSVSETIASVERLLAQIG